MPQGLWVTSPVCARYIRVCPSVCVDMLALCVCMCVSVCGRRLGSSGPVGVMYTSHKYASPSSISLSTGLFMWPTCLVSFSWRWSRPGLGVRPKKVATGPWLAAGPLGQSVGGSLHPRLFLGCRRPGRCRRTSCRCCWGCLQVSGLDLRHLGAPSRDRRPSPNLDLGPDPGWCLLLLPHPRSWGCCGRGSERRVQTWCWCWGLCWWLVQRSEVDDSPAWRDATETTGRGYCPHFLSNIRATHRWNTQFSHFDTKRWKTAIMRRKLQDQSKAVIHEVVVTWAVPERSSPVTEVSTTGESQKQTDDFSAAPRWSWSLCCMLKNKGFKAPEDSGVRTIRRIQHFNKRCFVSTWRAFLPREEGSYHLMSSASRIQQCHWFRGLSFLLRCAAGGPGGKLQ